MKPTRRPSAPGAFSWAVYDWAISAFSTTVMAGFFPIFFKDYWSKGTEATDSTFWLAVSVSSASLIVSFCAPLLGAIADRGSAKKRSLLLFTLLGATASLALSFAGEGQWPLAAVLYVVAIIGSLGASVFYDSLLVNVSDEHSVDMLSARGYGLGYLGGGLLFLLNVLMVRNPDWFGLPDPAAAVRLVIRFRGRLVGDIFHSAVRQRPRTRVRPEAVPHRGRPVRIRGGGGNGAQIGAATVPSCSSWWHTGSTSTASIR